MNFELTYSREQDEFRAEVRDWFEREVPASLRRRATSVEESAAQYRDRRILGRRLGELYASIVD